MFCFTNILYLAIHVENNRTQFNRVFDFDSYMFQFLDRKDTKNLILTHLYLLVGCLWPASFALGHRLSTGCVPMSGLIALCIGDSFVSSSGRHYWKQVWENADLEEEDHGRLHGLRVHGNRVCLRFEFAHKH